MRIVAADSGSAILNERFEPQILVAIAAVLVEPPYNRASVSMFSSLLEETPPRTPFVAELSICKDLLKRVNGDEVHLDMTLGGVSINELTSAKLMDLPISKWAKENIQKELPELRRLAHEIKRIYGIEVLALGKESMPVRIAELTAGAHSILYTAEKVVRDGRQLLLGLPVNCNAKLCEGGILLQSLISNEHEVAGFAVDLEGVLSKVRMREIINPKTRGFRALEIFSKQFCCQRFSNLSAL